MPTLKQIVKEIVLKRNRVIGLVLATVAIVVGCIFAPTGVQAAVSYLSTTQIVQTSITKNGSASTDWTNASVVCPIGFKVTGGGATLTSTQYGLITPYNNMFFITNSAPTTNGWSAQVNGLNYTLRFNVYAICVK